MANNISNLAQSIKKKTSKYVILGFGISDAKQASSVSKLDIDGIVIGTAFIKLMSSSHSYNIIHNISAFCAQIRSAIDS